MVRYGTYVPDHIRDAELAKADGKGMSPRGESELAADSYGEGYWQLDPAKLEILEKVGDGNTAEVFRALLDDGEGKHVVAVKKMFWDKKSMGEGSSQMKAFDRETAVMAKVKHPNLVDLIGVCEQKDFQVVTEFMAGGDLFELLHGEEPVDLSWMQRMKLATDVAAGMQYLHGMDPPIVHRDLKSLNLLLKEPVRSPQDVPTAKVTDFGIARMKEVTGTGLDWGKMTQKAGTCHWMAPEVIRGTTYDEKCDVYSFAMILYEIICQEIPFEDEDSGAVAELAVAGERPTLEAVPPDCPQLLRDLMIRCWAHDPADRPHFAMVLEILERVPVPVDS